MSLYIRFTELYPDVLSKCLGCAPAVWPYHAQCFQYDEDDEVVEDPEYTYGLWNREDNRELLREVLVDRRGFWTSQEGVLIPSSETWVCKEREADLKLVCCNFPASLGTLPESVLGDIQLDAFVRLTETCGWCAFIQDSEMSGWWFMFTKAYYDKAQRVYELMADAKYPARKIMIKGNEIHREEYDWKE